MNEYELFLYETSIETLNLRSMRERLFPSVRRACRSSVRDQETSMPRRNTAELNTLIASVRNAKAVKA